MPPCWQRSELLARLPALQDLKSAWLLLLLCAAPRCNYLLRTVPPSLTDDFATAHDAAVSRCIAILLAGGDEPFAQLPLRMGGLGLTFAREHRHAAYWASWADTIGALRECHQQPPSSACLRATGLRLSCRTATRGHFGSNRGLLGGTRLLLGTAVQLGDLLPPLGLGGKLERRVSYAAACNVWRPRSAQAPSWRSLIATSSSSRSPTSLRPGGASPARGLPRNHPVRHRPTCPGRPPPRRRLRAAGRTHPLVPLQLL